MATVEVCMAIVRVISLISAVIQQVQQNKELCVELATSLSFLEPLLSRADEYKTKVNAVAFEAFKTSVQEMHAYISGFTQKPHGGWGIRDKIDKLYNGKTIREKFLSYQDKILAFRSLLTDLSQYEIARCMGNMEKVIQNLRYSD
jgi:hypothetical protein